MRLLAGKRSPAPHAAAVDDDCVWRRTDRPVEAMAVNAADTVELAARAAPRAMLDVPGLRPDNVEIELENDQLTVRGERPFPYPREDGKGPVRSIERGFGRFERSIRVPRGLDPDAIDASLSDGVLTLRIPKPETMRPRRIEIKAQENGSRQEVSTGQSQTTTDGA